MRAPTRIQQPPPAKGRQCRAADETPGGHIAVDYRPGTVHPRRFGPDQPHLTLSQIIDRTGLPITTTFRPLGEFVECGALVRGADRRYRIGPRLIDGHHSETELKSRRGAETVSSKFPAGHTRL